MIRRLRIGSLIVGLLLTACLVAGAYVALHFNIGGIQYFPPQPSAFSSLESSPVSPFIGQHKSKVIGAVSSRQTKIREFARRQARQRGTRNIVPAEKAGSGVSALLPGLSAQATLSLEPDRKTLKPIGYVQKANGLVEAIVSDGDGVQVVHVGDAFEEKYTVTQITPEAVEIVASSTSPTVLPSAPTVASNSTPGIRLGTNEPKPIGYAEMSAGNRIAVIPDGEFVRLEYPKDSLAGRRGIETGSNPVEIASAPEPTVRKLAATNFNRIKAQPVPPVHLATPTQGLKKPSDAIVRPQQITPGHALKRVGIDDHQSDASRTLGFVEKADGRVQAIVDEGEGVKFVQVGDNLPGILLAAGDSDEAAKGALGSDEASAPSPVALANAHFSKGGPPGPSPGGRQSFPPGPVQTGDTGKDSASGGPLEPLEPPDKPPPGGEASVAEDTVVPDKPPPDDVMAASTGLEAEVAGSSKRDEAVLKSLGYLNAQDWRASPHITSLEPEAQPRGSPASDTTVLRSFSYGDWKYGRASPLATSLEVAARANGSQNTTVLKSIGYLDWQDGHALAVVDDGDGGVRLIHEGELLDDDTFRVVKVYPEAVEIAELPISPSGLGGNSIFRPEAPPLVAKGVRLPGALGKKPLGSGATARLAHKVGQPSQQAAGPASVPNESSLAPLSFASNSQSVPCFDFKSLLTMPGASPGPWSFSALNLYFPHRTSPAIAKATTPTCPGAIAFRP